MPPPQKQASINQASNQPMMTLKFPNSRDGKETSMMIMMMISTSFLKEPPVLQGQMCQKIEILFNEAAFLLKSQNPLSKALETALRCRKSNNPDPKCGYLSYPDRKIAESRRNQTQIPDAKPSSVKCDSSD